MGGGGNCFKLLLFPECYWKKLLQEEDEWLAECHCLCGFAIFLECNSICVFNNCICFRMGLRVFLSVCVERITFSLFRAKRCCKLIEMRIRIKISRRKIVRLSKFLLLTLLYKSLCARRKFATHEKR